MEFSTEALVTFGIFGALGIIIPLGAMIFYCVKNKDAWKLSAVVGMGVFVVFALILEQILHSIMLPVIGTNVIFYVIYGSIAAGVFEETGRFVAFKTIMKKRLTTKNAVLGGLGHGGFEAAFLLGVNFISYLAIGLSVNSMGVEKFVEMSAQGNTNIAAQLSLQIETLSGTTFALGAAALFERIIAMTAHVCFAVIVYKSVESGKIRLFPAAILLHALLDAPAAMYQVGILPLAAIYIYMVIFAAALVVLSIFICKKFPAKTERVE